MCETKLKKVEFPKFEELLNFYPRNTVVFRRLMKVISKEPNQLTCFIGTGLSLYYKDWGGPFRDIIEYLEHYCGDKRQGIYKAFHKELCKASTLIKQGEFLEAGDIIDNWLEKNKGFGHNSLNECFATCLCDKFQQEAMIKELRRKQENFKSGKCPDDAISYLPFLGKGLHLTTNADNSIEKAFEWAGYTPAHFGNIDHIVGHLETNGNTAHAVIYIHGRFNVPETLVMSNVAYKERYDDGATTWMPYFQNVVRGWYVLFMGSGIVKDRFSEFIQPLQQDNLSYFSLECVTNDRSANVKSCTHEESIKIQERQEAIKKKIGAEGIFLPHFANYSILLCHLLRLTSRGAWSYDLLENAREGKYIKDIKQELCSRKKFSVKALSDDVTLPDVYHTLYEITHEKDTGNPNFLWAVCEAIGQNRGIDFPYGKKSFSPQNYHEPLGNTVYVIDSDYARRNVIERLVLRIKCWSKQRPCAGNRSKIRILIVPPSQRNRRYDIWMEQIETALKKRSVDSWEFHEILQNILATMTELNGYDLEEVIAVLIKAMHATLQQSKSNEYVYLQENKEDIVKFLNKLQEPEKGFTRTRVK